MAILLGSQRDAQGFLKRFRTAGEAGVNFKTEVEWWQYCKLLLHMDGVDGSTIFTDDSDAGHTVSANGDAQIDTGRSKFGGASALFDGSGDYLSIPDNADWSIGGDDFTFDFWFYPTDENRRALFASTSDYWLGVDYHYQGTRNVNIWASSTGSSWDLINSDGGGNGIGSISLTLNEWNHIAFVRHGDNWLTFVNGVKDVDITVTGSVIDKSEAWNIGRWGGDGINKILGSIDEFRFLKGYAAWTADFTPPTSPYSKVA